MLSIYINTRLIFTACRCAGKDEKSRARTQRDFSSLVSTCFFTDGACPRRYDIHRKFDLLLAFRYSTTRAWRILAALATVLSSVLERLHYFVLVREGLLRSLAAGRAWWSLADFAFQLIEIFSFSFTCDRKLRHCQVDLAGAAAVGVLGPALQLRRVAR